MILRDLAHARAGDKGDTLLVSVICHRPEDFARVGRALTADRVTSAFAGIAQGPVTRRDLPVQAAYLFRIEKALGGGVSTSLSADPHGKSLSSLMLAISLEDAP
jgi:hypothetical protein